MNRIQIIQGKGERVESLGTVAVLTSGGVPPVWSALTEHLPRQGKILDFGSWHGLCALWLKSLNPQLPVVFAHTSSSRVAQAGANAAASGLSLECRAMFPLEGNWDTIILAAPEEGDALQMYSAQAGGCLNPGGQVFVVDRYPRRELLASVYNSVDHLGGGENWVLYRCSGPTDKEFPLPWQKISVVFGEIERDLVSLPGNFSPRGLDAGTRAMLEELRVPKGARVLDLACGYGVVGIIATLLGAGEVQYIDDDLAAITACRHNLNLVGLEGSPVHSHLPNDVSGKFDCILTNPPYHTDYGVARSFLEFAARRLNPGGWLHVVVKKPDWYRNKLHSLFGGVRAVQSSGYHVLSAQQRQIVRQRNSGKTTRKHQLRQQAAKARGRRSGRD